jgi:hypothetical protein
MSCLILFIVDDDALLSGGDIVAWLRLIGIDLIHLEPLHGLEDGGVSDESAAHIW